MTEDNWTEMLDIISELETDLKENRRGLRHLASLRTIVGQIGQEIKTNMETVKKRKLF